MTVLAAGLLGAGGAILALAAWGVVRLPDALARQHAATKAGTLALSLTGLGAVLAVAEVAWAWRLALLLGFLFATMPVASHMLARAAVREAGDAAGIGGAVRVGGDPEGPRDGGP